MKKRMTTDAKLDVLIGKFDQLLEFLTPYVKENERRWLENERRWEENERRWEENERQHRRTQESIDRLEIKMDHHFQELKESIRNLDARVTKLETWRSTFAH